MWRKNISEAKDCEKLAYSNEELHERVPEPEDMPLTSTPVKMNERRSVSLLDISLIDSTLKKTNTHVSSDTLGSSSSICKDSGYNHSESSLTSDKAKEGSSPSPIDFREKYFCLLEDLKFKDVMITSLHESNYSLRMKVAEAENKIFELRLKCESHCKCCAYQSPVNSVDFKSPNSVKFQYKYSVSPVKKSDPCLLVQPPNKEDTKRMKSKIPSINEPPALPSESAFVKVKEWQKTYKECQKRLVSNVPSPLCSSPIDEERANTIYFSPVPEPLPQSLSYMETSRALAETYRRRQEKSPDLFSYQVIGDHSVAVSPLHLVRGSLYINESGQNKCVPKPESEKEMLNDSSSARQSLIGNMFFRNQELLRRSTVFNAIPLQRFLNPSFHTDYFRLL